MIDTVLVANRGEIALRVVRTCREMGIRTVVVHSTADRDSLAVRMADVTVQIGPAQPRRSYLSAPAIIEAERPRQRCRDRCARRWSRPRWLVPGRPDTSARARSSSW